MRLQGRTALVTGAGSGIGEAIAVALAAEGARLALVGRTPGKLQRVAARIGDTASCFPADLADDTAVDGLTDALDRRFGPIDVLIHSAGTIALGRVEAAPTEELDRHYRVNLRAPYALTRALLPQLRARKGQIVFINSSAGVQAAAGVSQYAATKHALRALADSLRAELNPEGVRVISIYPGRTASPMQAAIFAAEGRTYSPETLLQPEDVAAMVLDALLLPRTAEVTDVHIRPLLKAS